MLALGAPGRGPSPFVVAERRRACDERRSAAANDKYADLHA